MSIEDLLAREAIRQTMANYNIAGDRMQLDELAAQFTEDGVLKFPGQVARGRVEIVEKLGGGRRAPAEADASDAARRGPVTKVRHNLTTSQIVVDGEQATGRTYFLVVTNYGPDHMGVYVDRFRKVDGRWLIAERDVRIDWQSDASGFAPMMSAT